MAGPILHSEQCVHLQISHPQVSQSFFYFTFVYAKHTRSEWNYLWQDFLCLPQLFGDRPWMVAADFNMVSLLDEYSGHSTCNLAVISDFNAFPNCRGSLT